MNKSMENNKNLMTGPKRNSEVCFPETPNVPEAKPFCYTPQLNARMSVYDFIAKCYKSQ